MTKRESHPHEGRPPETGQDLVTSIPPVSDEVAKPDVHRIKLSREAAGRCLTCGVSWRHGWALAKAVEHVRYTGHLVTGRYSAEYLYLRVGGDND